MSSTSIIVSVNSRLVSREKFKENLDILEKRKKNKENECKSDALENEISRSKHIKIEHFLTLPKIVETKPLGNHKKLNFTEKKPSKPNPKTTLYLKVKKDNGETSKEVSTNSEDPHRQRYVAARKRMADILWLIKPLPRILTTFSIKLFYNTPICDFYLLKLFSDFIIVPF